MPKLRSCLQCGKETKNPKFCSLSCFGKYNAKKERNPRRRSSVAGYHAWKAGDVGALSKKAREQGILERTFREMFFEDYDNKCQRCGWTYRKDKHTLPPLHISHRDNDHKNNSYENLELLCPNCHAVHQQHFPTPVGRGRRSRRQRQKESNPQPAE